MLNPMDTATLKPAREAARMSRAVLAAAAGLNETTILRIERGDVDPRLRSTWAPIVRALTSGQGSEADHGVVDTDASATPSSGNTDQLSSAEAAA